MTMNLRFLYPAPDVLTVYGYDNATYWLMLLVRSEAIHELKVLYYLAVAIEVVALIVGFTLHIRGVITMNYLSAVHVNFGLIGAQMYLLMIIGSIGRLFTIPYETRIVHFSGLQSAPIPFLAIIRQSAYAQGFFILIVWTIERTCATIYVADYEKKSRLYISFILNFFSIVACYVTGYVIVTGVVNVISFTAVIQISNISCALWFRWLIRHNELRLGRLTDQINRHSDEYSLSLRMQLKENIWSMKKIEFGVYVLTAGLLANMGLVFLPILFLSAPDQFETLQWFTCVGNLAYAFSILLTSPALEVAIAIHTGRVPPFLKSILGDKYFTEKTPVKREGAEIESYFKQLDSQWTQGLSIRDSR